MSDKVYIITHTNPDIKTVRDLVNEKGSPAAAYAGNIDAFGQVEIRKGYTNKQALIDAHILAGDRKSAENVALADIVLVLNTKLAVEIEKLDRCALLTQGIEVVSNDFTMFKADKLAELESDTGYKTAVDLDSEANMEWMGKTMQRYPNATVWIWTKALSDYNAGEKNGKIFDLTPYLTRLVTNVSRSGGGHFQLSLAPIRCEMVNNTWVLRTADRKDYQKLDGIGRKQFFSSGNLFGIDGKIAEDGTRTLARNSFLFNNIITPNDVVFIRLETLEMEKVQREEDQLADIINKNSLPDRIYDMIALVDKTSITINATNNDVSIDVTGRDLSKLIYDDGTYFLPFEFTKGKMGGMGSATTNNPLIERMWNGNALSMLGPYNPQSLDTVIRFIIQQLSTIKIVPDDLFSAYNTGGKNRLNTRYDVLPADHATKEQLRGKLEQHKTEAKNIFARIRRDNSLAFQRKAEEEKKVDEIFAEVLRFFKHIRKMKVRSVAGNETKGWEKNTYVRQNGGNEVVPADSIPIYFRENIYGLISDEAASVTMLYADNWMPAIDAYIDLEHAQPTYKEELTASAAKGIWQIVKMVVDKNVSSRLLIDSSMSTATGSLINFFKKICQHPFVEFQMDTYGDMFYIMVRKPPFDRKSILSALKGSIRTEQHTDSATGETTTTEIRKPAVITVESSQVLSETLEFSDTEAVSWYQLIPKANPIGPRDSFAMAALPALYFKEYAEYFGSRSMQLTHNYLPSTVYSGRNMGELNIIEAQSIFDLKQMIESTAYLPFTRQGTITILRDRRIKAGNFIRYEPTGEIFFVEGVQHNLQVTDTSVEATTAIQVSRGMVEQLIYGVPIKAQPGSADTEVVYASYFNIIQTISEFRYAELKSNKVVTTTEVPPATATPSQSAATTQEANKKEEQPAASKSTRRAELDARNEIAKGVLERYPEAQWPIIRDFIREINRTTDYWVIILPEAGPRTKAEQTVLWTKNKRNALPGTSRHERSAALDISLIHKKTKKIISKSTPLEIWKSTGVVEVGDRVGMQWTDGRGYGNFLSRSGGKPYYDPVHFQIKDPVLASLAKGTPYKQPDPPAEVVNIAQTGAAQKNVSNIDDVFKYFKVNPTVFNYFLNRLQMNPTFRTVTSKQVLVGINDDADIEVIGQRMKPNKK